MDTHVRRAVGYATLRWASVVQLSPKPVSSPAHHTLLDAQKCPPLNAATVTKGRAMGTRKTTSGRKAADLNAQLQKLLSQLSTDSIPIPKSRIPKLGLKKPKKRRP